jgi:hypothetical protein
MWIALTWLHASQTRVLSDLEPPPKAKEFHNAKFRVMWKALRLPILPFAWHMRSCDLLS